MATAVAFLYGFYFMKNSNIIPVLKRRRTALCYHLLGDKWLAADGGWERGICGRRLLPVQSSAY